MTIFIDRSIVPDTKRIATIMIALIVIISVAIIPIIMVAAIMISALITVVMVSVRNDHTGRYRQRGKSQNNQHSYFHARLHMSMIRTRLQSSRRRKRNTTLTTSEAVVP